MISIDSREPSSLTEQIEDLFDSECLSHEIATLDVGDYSFTSANLERVVIERKEIHDFLNSMRNNRLMDQLFRMLSEHDIDVPILLIEGVMSIDSDGKCRTFKRKTHWRFSSVANFELSIQQYGIRVVHVPSHKHTAAYIMDLYKYFQKEFHESIAIPTMPFPSATAKNLRDIHLRLFLALPGVGQERANKLMKKYHHIDALCQAEEAELQKFVGKTTGKRIWKALHG